MQTRQKTILVVSDDEAPGPAFTCAAQPAGEWKVPMFSLTDPHNFAMSICCPAVSLAKILAVFGPVPYRSTLMYSFFWLIALLLSIAVLLQYPSSLVPITIVVLVSIVPWLIIFNVRYAMRVHFNMPSTDLQDCCASLWCYPFVLSQMSIQMDVNTPGQCDFTDNATLIAYTNA